MTKDNQGTSAHSGARVVAPLLSFSCPLFPGFSYRDVPILLLPVGAGLADRPPLFLFSSRQRRTLRLLLLAVLSPARRIVALVLIVLGRCGAAALAGVRRATILVHVVGTPRVDVDIRW